jgi:hypothetical protein
VNLKKSLLVLALAAPVLSGVAATSIDLINRYAYGANIGWMDGVADTNNGAVIGQYYCWGSLYSANVGWINFGGGSPANSVAYQNNTSSDFGVNTDGSGHLRGYAYGANIGWVAFETNGNPEVNLLTGQLSGSVWSANCGWISLSNAVAYVQTDTLSPGPLDVGGLPIAWELTYFGVTGVNPNADPDGDGMSNYEEYLAGTDPTNPNDSLAIVAATLAPGGTNASLTWRSKPTHYYYLDQTLSLSPVNWYDSGLGRITPSPGSTTSASFTATNAPDRFYRVRGYQALPP